ncbi:hypothetical protein [Oceanobacillus chungangensis]|uniref:hypothetical protein n=1 Tax=Oceanobacillus chungangensis TaxID=1229152 RepID=UPI001474C019
MAISITSAIVLIIILNWIIFSRLFNNHFSNCIDYHHWNRLYGKSILEWRYTKNPKKSILTISEMFILVLVLIVIIQFTVFIALTGAIVKQDYCIELWN